MNNNAIPSCEQAQDKMPVASIGGKLYNTAIVPDGDAFEACCEFVQDIFTMPERMARIVKLAQDNGLYINMVMAMVEPYFALENITSYDHSDAAFDKVFEYLRANAEEECNPSGGVGV